MLDLTDSRWTTMLGGYRLPYDPRGAFVALEADGSSETAWSELWENLHHQGNVGEASYAALVILTEMNSKRAFPGSSFLALAATIEAERHASRNPPVPTWFADRYRAALLAILDAALSVLRTASDPYVLRSALSAVALTRGQVKLGVMLSSIDDSEIDAWAEERRAWSEIYGA